MAASAPKALAALDAIGSRTRTGLLGPIDRALGLGFGALKGLIMVSLGFLLVTLAIDTVSGGPAKRPDWMTDARTYPLLNATSSAIADFVDRRRRGEPVFGPDGPFGGATPTPSSSRTPA